MGRVVASLAVFVCFGVLACGSGNGISELSVEERFERAKALFQEEQFLEAVNEFNIITLQYQGSAVADDAQFYLGECRFERGEYLLAAFEYEQLKRNTPASPLVPEGQYKLALCYYNLSPQSHLDQQYTLKSIDAFQSFVEYYPGHTRAPEAEEKIRELNARLAKKEFDTARLYATLGYSRSAMLYYDGVIEKFHDTEYAPLAHLGKVEALIDRKRYGDAKKGLERFFSLYSDSVLRARGDRLKTIIDDFLTKE